MTADHVFKTADFQSEEKMQDLPKFYPLKKSFVDEVWESFQKGIRKHGVGSR